MEIWYLVAHMEETSKWVMYRHATRPVLALRLPCPTRPDMHVSVLQIIALCVNAHSTSALTRGARVQDSTTAVMSRWQDGQREQLLTEFSPRLSLLQSTHSPNPARVPHVPHRPAPSGPDYTRWSRVEL